MPNQTQESHKTFDHGSSASFAHVDCSPSRSSSCSTSTFSHLHNIEDDTSHSFHPGTEEMADNIISLPTGTSSSKAFTQENLNAFQQQMDGGNNNNAAPAREQSRQQTYLKLTDAALSLGIPLAEGFMNEL